MAYATQTQGSNNGIAARLGAIAADISERFARRRLYNRTYRELAALSGRELEDLGIHRSQIGQIAYQAAYNR